jgi:hypothetical protein
MNRRAESLRGIYAEPYSVHPNCFISGGSPQSSWDSPSESSLIGPASESYRIWRIVKEQTSVKIKIYLLTVDMFPEEGMARNPTDMYTVFQNFWNESGEHDVSGGALLPEDILAVRQS